MPSFSKLLPFILIVFALAFSVRLSDVVTGVQGISSTAYAKSEEKKEESSNDAHNDDAPEEKSMDSHDEDVEVVEGKDSDTPEWKDASDSDIDISGVKAEMLGDMVDRRKKLDKQEKNLISKEALLRATEKEMDRKILELEKLKKEIESLLTQQTEEEKERVSSLVKIYEGMKPKDAARIFDTLDVDVLVAVMSQMSERKVAPVLAAMSAERARTVTIMLAEQKKLPQLR
ncbi:MAG: MotE family protein [Alphaproteobacteria bacterium]